MAGPNQSDQLAELSLALLDLYRSSGLVRQRLGFDNWDDVGGNLGRLAKQAGATPEMAQAWLDGTETPMAGQALALCRALRLAGEPAALNGAAQ
jgi:hypothetical protein